MGDVVKFDGLTTADEPADQVLEKAKTWDLEAVVVAGLTSEGGLIVGGNTGDKALVNLIIDLAKQDILA